ncbi:MAG TPA: GlsB/YeaQ/YmgE family stress response membrane protein [Candidatus Nitrosotalea sp.]|nr:GlsB/YeaQ/YmgE family stress response membrane protein [Candidatus Nitrosotalea sp.]
MPTTVAVQINLQYILIWALVGLVAGLLASRVMLGHGMGLIADIVVGILGAVIGNVAASSLGVQVSVANHPLVSQILIAVFGALILLLVLRLLGMGRRGRRRPVL